MTYGTLRLGRKFRENIRDDAVGWDRTKVPITESCDDMRSATQFGFMKDCEAGICHDQVLSEFENLLPSCTSKIESR